MLKRVMKGNEKNPKSWAEPEASTHLLQVDRATMHTAVIPFQGHPKILTPRLQEYVVGPGSWG